MSYRGNDGNLFPLRNALALSIAAAMLAGCSGGGGWLPWSSGGAGGPYTPPGATGYACEGGKRLLVRFESDAKSAWVIYPDRQLRLDRVTSASGEQFSRAGTTLTTVEGETTLTESGAMQFARCKPEQAK
jgi:membrane-bound inhibitor of C-type lysozyme